MEEKRSSNRIVSYLVIFFIGCLAMYAVVYFFPTSITESITKVEKDVTVTDAGIADAVEKLYDATVIVGVDWKNNQLVSWGSGVVYKVEGNDAYILTNHHVVDGASKIVIYYTDDTEAEGTLVGSDEYMDTAVIKVDAKTIKAVAEIGDSSKVGVGDTVFAIGTPVSLNYKFTTTRGILSAKDRFVAMSNATNSMFGYSNGETWYMKLLQTDTAINSGNSGGPLANANGELIGITNSKSGGYTSSGASIENIGFAIPIEDAINMAEQLIKSGKVTRGYLGIAMTTIEGAQEYDIKVPDNITEGVVIAEVEKGYTADEAGLKKGDIITKLGDYDVKNYMYLKYYLYRYSVGDKVTIKYIRDGKEQSVDITIAAKNKNI